MDSLHLIVAIGAAFAGFVQGLSGFGFGMTAMSFWAWTIDPRLAAVMAVFGAMSGQILTAVTVRRGFNVRQVLPFIVGGLLGIPIGIAILPMLDPVLFKAALGTFLVIWCPAMLMIRYLPKITVGGRIADGVSGLCGGVMSGVGGFSGVVPTLWCTLRQFDKDAQRSIIQNFNLATLSVTFVSYLATGIVTREMWPMFAIVAPAMLIPSLLGSRLYIGISELTFRKIVLGLLTASGVAMLVSAVPQLVSGR